MKKIWMLLTTFLKAGATIRAQGNMIYLIFNSREFSPQCLATLNLAATKEQHRTWGNLEYVHAQTN